MISKTLDIYFPKLASVPELKENIIKISSIHRFNEGTVILKQGTYVKVIPLVISGLVKVFKEEAMNGNEVLLYYIKPGESCIMSVTTSVRNELSQVKAVIEKDAEIILIPADLALKIAKKYPKWNEFIYELFNLKFEEILHIIEILTFSNKDTRLLEYLKKEAELGNSFSIAKTHQQIANELGSSREVISRLLKKLEHEGYIRMRQSNIELIDN